ncbi:MAG: PDZ domain-containing protein [Anaerolineae bacterium]|nr:PDZ domain-containing protein [Anaerolineae bacterium]
MRRRWAMACMAMVVVATGFLAGFSVSWLRQPEVRADTGIPLVWEVWGYVERYFYGQVPDDRELVYGAIDGALETLKDPYTRLVRPVAHTIERDRLRGAFGGVGAWVYEMEGLLYLRPLPDTPADRAGVKDGDRLLAVDGVELPEGATVDLAVSWIRGPVGTSVTLSVYRPETGTTLEFTVERAEIPQPSVEYMLLEDTEPPVGYVKIVLFSERTPAEVQRALASVRHDGAAMLVLDLRGNPGGLLESAVEVSSRFLRSGAVVYEVDAAGNERRFSVRPRVTVSEPLVVLVDEGTASAAEILAGALQDQGRALLVGRTTRGKGSVQLAYELSDGSSLHVTASVWLTPDRRKIDGVGLEPDVVVEGMASDEDAILNEGLELLGAKRVPDAQERPMARRGAP